MFFSKCPYCGSLAYRNAKQSNHLTHQAHGLHQVHDFIHKNHFFKNNPIGLTVGLVGLGAIAVIDMFHDQTYECKNGHSFTK